MIDNTLSQQEDGHACGVFALAFEHCLAESGCFPTPESFRFTHASVPHFRDQILQALLVGKVTPTAWIATQSSKANWSAVPIDLPDNPIPFINPKGREGVVSGRKERLGKLKE